MQLHHNYFDSYKKLDEENKIKFDYKQFEMTDEENQKPKSTEDVIMNRKINELQKPSWVNLTEEDFNLLIKDVVDNLDDENYKTTVNNRKYNLRNTENFLLEITTKIDSKNEALKLYDDLIKEDIAALEKDGENVSKLESVEVVLVHCNLIKNDYQHRSKVLFTFILNNLVS